MSEESTTSPGVVGPFDPDGDPCSYKYKLMADHLAARIASGELAPDQPLPAEGELAVHYGVSLGTARHATRLLRERGLVLTLRSKGTYIARRLNLRHTGEGDSDVRTVVVDGVDLAGKRAPVLVERHLAEEGPGVQMHIGGEGKVALSATLLDELKIAHTVVLSDDETT